MKVTCERLEDSQVLLHIEVEPERAAKSMDQAYHRLVNRVSIPGFRKGKAPRHIVERMIGHDALVQEGIDSLLPEVFREAVAETGIEPIDKPQVDIVQEQPLVVNMTVPVWPTVKLGEYHDIHAEREHVTVRESEVDDVLQQLREQHAEWMPVERPAAAGDRVTIDAIGHVRGVPVLYDPEGKAILETATGEPVVDQKGVEYTITPGHPVPVQGFAEELIGLRAGDDKRFELNFPAEYPDRQLANKAVIFHVTVHSGKEKRLPELDDEFAKTVGDYETLESLRQSVRENLQRRAEHEAQHRLEERVLNMVADKARIELPPALVEREIDRLVDQADHQLRRSNASMDEYLRVSKKSKEELRAGYRADAIANLRRYLVLTDVAKGETIDVTPDEVDAEVRKISEVLEKLGARAGAALREPDRREDLAGQLRRDKALERLVAIATGQATAQPPATGEQAGETQEVE